MAVLRQVSGRVVVMDDACDEEGAPSCCRVMARGSCVGHVGRLAAASNAAQQQQQQQQLQRR
jgi:hypothetical protein